MKIQISIIIATYNAAAVLSKCLDSIVEQLNEECELIIIDGGSCDATVEVISSYKEHVSYTVSEKDHGIYDAWNKGIRAAKGEWIAFVGADDLLCPNAINNYLRVLRETKDVEKFDYICAQVERVDRSGNILRVIGEKPVWRKMRKHMVSAMIFSLHNKKNLYDTVGYYDFENFHICADYELLMRKKNELQSLMIPFRVARMEVGGMSFSTKAIFETYQIRKKHHSVPTIYNYYLLLTDCLFYEFFKLRMKRYGAKHQ